MDFRCTEDEMIKQDDAGRKIAGKEKQKPTPPKNLDGLIKLLGPDELRQVVGGTTVGGNQGRGHSYLPSPKLV
jgi:hypothetical protein